MEIVDYESVARSLSAAMMLAQMGIVGRKVIMAVRDNFGIVRAPISLSCFSYPWRARYECLDNLAIRYCPVAAKTE